MIDSARATSNGLQIVPSGTCHDALARDCDARVTYGMTVGNAAGFDELMQACEVLHARVNAGCGKVK